MFKLVHGIAVAALALALPYAAMADITNQMVTLSSGQIVSLDTGTIVNSGGDLMWDGTNRIPQGSMHVFVLMNQGSAAPGVFLAFGTTEIDADFMNCGGSQSNVPGTVNQLFMALTNGEHDAKVLVTAQSGTSITIEFTTYTSTHNTSCAGKGGGNAPSISGITNIYSNIPPGAPTYGIAQGSLFVIYGSNLASGNNIPKTPIPLQTSLSGTSITYQDSSSAMLNIGMYYVTPGQIAAVMPSTAKTGAGTLTVNAPNSQTISVPLNVVDSAIGIDTIGGTGFGQGVATDKFGKLFGYNYSAIPGQKMIFWGSGVGADTANGNDYSISHQDNLYPNKIAMKAYVGGVEANIDYAGRSTFPGVDQIIVTVPPGVAAAVAAAAKRHAQPYSVSNEVTYGCNVSVVFVSGANSTPSNAVSSPINSTPDPCEDANGLLSGNDITALSGQGDVSLGYISIEQSVSQQLTTTASAAVPALRPRPFGLGPRAVPTTASQMGTASFNKYKGSDLKRYAAYEQVTLGGCIVIVEAESTTGITDPVQPTGLRAGTITSKDKAGTAETWQAAPTLTGFYFDDFPSGYINTAGDAITVTATAGPDIGAIDPVVTFQSPLFSWNEVTSITSVTRSQGVTTTWKGAVPGTDVVIIGGSSNGHVAGVFICYAPAEAETFTVESYITEQMPQGQGDLILINDTVPVPFTASGLTRAWATGSVSNTAFPTYN